MIDKKKFIKFNRITIVLVLIFILLILGRTFSSFQTDGKGKANLDIAFYVLDTKTQSEDIKMFEIAPDGQDYVYSINVFLTPAIQEAMFGCYIFINEYVVR